MRSYWDWDWTGLDGTGTGTCTRLGAKDHPAAAYQLISVHG